MKEKFKFEIGEIVQMVMGRSVYAHFDGEMAAITNRMISPTGCELYRMNPIKKDLQQNVRFPVGSLRKITPVGLEPLSKVHLDQLEMPQEWIVRKTNMLNKKWLDNVKRMN